MSLKKSETSFKTVVIGGSSGALAVIHTMMKLLPDDFNSAIVIVLHLSADAESLITAGSMSRNNLTMVTINDKQKLEAGTIYIVPGDYHCHLESDLSFSLSMDEPVHFCRPSIDILFESMATSLKGDCIGILLSGANKDGAKGLKSLQKSGAYTMVQSVESSESPEMPLAALDLNAAEFIGTPKQLISKLLSL